MCVLFFGQEVYYVVSGDSTLESIDVSLRSASRWPSLGFLGEGDLPGDLLEKPRRSASELKALAAHAVIVLVGAFDEEGYLFWNL